jgi:hypothetical protein
VQKDPARLAREEFYEKYILTGKYTRNEAIVSHYIYPEEIVQLFDISSEEWLGDAQDGRL